MFRLFDCYTAPTKALQLKYNKVNLGINYDISYFVGGVYIIPLVLLDETWSPMFKLLS